MVLYNASAVEPTAQLSALKTRFMREGCLIINKLTHLQVSKLDEDGTKMRKVFDIPFNSTIAAVEAIQLPDRGLSTLLVLTTSMHFFALEYGGVAGHYECLSSVSILEQFGRLAEYQTIVVDPQLRCILVYAYSGLLRVFPLVSLPRPNKKGRTSVASLERTLDLTKGYNIRLPSLNVTCLTCLDEPGTDDPSIATVFLDHKSRPTLSTHYVDLRGREVEPGPLEDVLLDDAGSELAIPVESEDGGTAGLLVVGEETITFQTLTPSNDKGKGKASESAAIPSCKIPVGNVTAWTALPGDRNRFLLGDLFGKLMLLELSRSSAGKVTALSVRDLGDAASPTSLVFIDTETLYLSSRFSDSQLIKIAVSASSKDQMDVDQSELELLSTDASLAPIVDFCVVPGEAGASSSVVTCSGAYKGGSLRVVRQGVGMNELASVDIQGVQRLWSVWPDDSDPNTLLVIGTINSTLLLSFANDEVEEVDLPGFVTDEQTLWAQNLGKGVCQVTPSRVVLITQGTTKSWQPEGNKKITLASIGTPWLVVAIEGGQLVSFDESLQQQSSVIMDQEVASVDVKDAHGGPFAAVALWTTQVVHILDVPTLSSVSNVAIPSTFLIRSVALAPFDEGTRLFAGLGDGTLVGYAFDGKRIDEDSRKIVTVGTQPVSMRLIGTGQRGRGTGVFVASDRPTIVSCVSDKLVYSSVNLKNVVAVSAFDSAGYEDCVAIASSDSIRIGRVQMLQRVDIRAISLDEDEPRRIAYHAESHCFAVLCLRRDIDRRTGEQSSSSTVKIVDEQTFEVVTSFDLQLGEQGQSVMPTKTDADQPAFAVGTAYLEEGKKEVEKGRLLLFVERDGAWSQSASLEIGGAPYSIAQLSDQHLAVAINSQVEVFKQENDAFRSVAKWAGNFISLAVGSAPDDTLIVADALRSVAVLRFVSSPSPKLVEIARDFSSYYMTAVARLTEATSDYRDTSVEYVGADSDLNLFTVMKENTTTQRSVADEHSLTPRGVFHLGQLVSRFAQGSLVPRFGETSTAITPRLVYATSAGAIGILVDLDERSSKLVSSLERNLRSFFTSSDWHQVPPNPDEHAGEECLDRLMKHDEWRAYKSERRVSPAAGFVDGDFVENVLALSKARLDQCFDGQVEHEKIEGKEREDTMRLVEELARLH